jgi:GNAT superfamily N-acetyltransferase
MDIKIRKATKEDFRGVLRLNRNMYKEIATNPDFGDWVFLKRPSKGNMFKWFTALLADARKGNAIYLVADVDGQIAGHCFVRMETPGSELSHVGVLSMLVDGAYRGRGIGRRLVDSVIRQSKGMFEILHLRMFSTNNIAKRLYKSRGFRRFGTAPRFIKRGSKYFDREYYYLSLR